MVKNITNYMGEQYLKKNNYSEFFLSIVFN